MEDSKKKEYERPAVVVDETNMEIDEAYSAAAVPAAAPAVTPVASAGGTVAAAILAKWC